MNEYRSPGVGDGGDAGYVHDIRMPQASVEEAGREYSVCHRVRRGDVILPAGYIVITSFEVTDSGMVPSSKVPFIEGDLYLAVKARFFQNVYCCADAAFRVIG